MKDLSSEGIERMLDTDATPFERELLEAGALERPSPELVLAMQRGLGIGPDVAPPVEPASPEPAAATSGASAWSSATLIKVGIGAAVSAGVVIAALSLPSSPVAPEAPSTPPALVPAAPPELPATPAPTPPAAETPASAPDPARELRLEIELLDRARAALSASDPARALGLLDEYAARFPTGTLAREAELLRGKVARAKLPAAPDRGTLESAPPTPARP